MIFEPSQRYSLNLGLYDSSFALFGAARSRAVNCVYVSNGYPSIITIEIDTRNLLSGKYYIELGVLKEPDDVLCAKTIAEVSFVIPGVPDAPVSFQPNVNWIVTE